MKTIKSESFFKGTIILICANTISKILGAILKIPLTYILGEEGMAIYQTAFSVYIMMLALITSGVPLAISRYTAAERALHNYGNIRYAINFSSIVMSILGISASLVMFFGSEFFAFSMKDPKAQLTICAISPAIFFVALGEVYKSFYQGYSCQTPTAVSQVTESFIKLAVGYTLASFFSVYSHKVSAAAAIFGVTVGEFFATLVLVLFFVPFLSQLKSSKISTPRSEIAKNLATVALPMTLISIVGAGLALLETSIIRSMLTKITFDAATATRFIERYSPYTRLFNKLAETKHLSFDGARWLFGAYSGYAATVFNLPVGVLASFGVAILPVITGAKALGNSRKINKAASGVTSAVFMLAVPCSILLWLFPGEILCILFENNASQLMLSFMAPLVTISALSQISGAILHAYGDIMTPFYNGLICSLVRIFLSIVLISKPGININGAIISSILSGALYFALNTLHLKKDGISVITPSTFIKTLAAGGIMALSATLILPVVHAHFSSEFITVAICSAVSGVAYLAALYVFGIIKKEEIIRLHR